MLWDLKPMFKIPVTDFIFLNNIYFTMFIQNKKLTSNGYKWELLP